MEGKTCCVTGHRDLPQKEINHVKTALRREICIWLYSLFCDTPGNYIHKPMKDCTGEEKDKSGAGADCCHSLSKAPGQPDGKGPDL